MGDIKEDLMKNYSGMAITFKKMGQLDSAIFYADTVLELGKLTHDMIKKLDALTLLSDIYKLKHNSDSVSKYLELAMEAKDSLFNTRKLIEIQSITFNEEIKRQELIDQQQQNENRLRMYILLGVLFVILLLAGILYRNNRNKQKAKLKIEKAYEELKATQAQLVESEKEKLQAYHHKELLELEAQALRAQMNPHFIFNCLSSINRFILKNKTEEASDYLTKFSRLIRMVLNNSKQSFISLEDELETLKLYLEMERLRFKNSFDYSFTYNNSVDPGNIFIPPLLLQPFAENAIWHGLMHKQEKGFLNFDFSAAEKTLTCIITDNGVGREQAELLKSKSAEKQKSMGLKITAERLSLLNNNSNGQTFFTIEDLRDENRNATGTRVCLKIYFKQMTEV
jgi:hypothetical protein